jgi:hypothetical protein
MITLRSVLLFIRDFIFVVVGIPIILVLLFLAYSGAYYMYSWRHTLTYEKSEKSMAISKKDSEKYMIIRADYKNMPKCSLQVFLDDIPAKFTLMNDSNLKEGVLSLRHKESYLKYTHKGRYQFRFYPKKLEGESELKLKCNCPTKSDWNEKVKFQIIYTKDADPLPFGGGFIDMLGV